MRVHAIHLFSYHGNKQWYQIQRFTCTHTQLQLGKLSQSLLLFPSISVCIQIVLRSCCLRSFSKLLNILVIPWRSIIIINRFFFFFHKNRVHFEICETQYPPSSKTVKSISRSASAKQTHSLNERREKFFSLSSTFKWLIVRVESKCRTRITNPSV